MLFKSIHLAGIRSGAIGLAFRRWEKPSVKEGTLLKTAIGLVEIVGIATVEEADVTDGDAAQAGYGDREALLRSLHQRTGGNLYRIAVRYHSADPRLALRERPLTEEAHGELGAKLARLDRHSKQGAWTQAVLAAIGAHPRLRAVEIARLTGFEKEWLKTNIRKLKNLGLTISLDVGYELSPLGRAYLDRADGE